MPNKWKADVHIHVLLFFLVVQTGGHTLSENQDVKNSFERRFLLDQTSATSNMSLEQFAACYLTCVSGYERLTDTCCKTGIDAVCSNLPWDLLKPRLGACPGLLATTVPAVWTSLEQFAACSLTCMHGYEKLTEVCCQTGLTAVCSNLPWNLLKTHLGTCQVIVTTTTPTTTKPTTTTTIPSPYWLPWGAWECKEQSGACYQHRSRNCSTGVDQDCKTSQGGVAFNIGLCTDMLCPARHPNQTFCLSCSDVVQPTDCDNQVMCNQGEVCYTEFINLNGEDRYRLGCVSNTACSKAPVSNSGPALVGKKRFVMNSARMDKYCSKCCLDDIGNCNRELCDNHGVIPPGTEVSELVNPPDRKDFCMDLFPDSCRLLIIQDTKLCTEPMYSHYACREFCGTCINPGHVTARPSTQAGSSVKPVVISTQVTTPQFPTTDCFYDSTKYMGSFTTTVTGKTCKNWADLDPTLQGLPDGSITVAGNMCRDPDGRGFPWCYTSDTFDWEFCRVPYCQECFYPNRSVNYAGYVSMDKDNNTCSSWSDYVAQTGDTSVKFPNNSVADAQNYCRDPKESGVPKCYVKGVLKECDVPQCSHDCRDDPETNCALVQQYVCQYEYTSATLCAKTCKMCKFGLLPPKKVDPPADLCVDIPDANCAILQSFICADTEEALKLCPRTCQLCKYFTTHAMQSTPPTDACQDDPSTTGCDDKDILSAVCKVKPTAWRFCRRSCGLCDTCWDYLNCSSPGAKKLFCGRDEYALQYCRQTCGRCDHKPVDVQLNKCGDPVASEAICELLQVEICICNDPDVRQLCGNYCDNNCGDHPFAGSNCKPAKRQTRDAFLSQVVLH